MGPVPPTPPPPGPPHTHAPCIKAGTGSPPAVANVGVLSLCKHRQDSKVRRQSESRPSPSQPGGNRRGILVDSWQTAALLTFLVRRPLGRGRDAGKGTPHAADAENSWKLVARSRRSDGFPFTVLPSLSEASRVSGRVSFLPRRSGLGCPPGASPPPFSVIYSLGGAGSRGLRAAVRCCPFTPRPDSPGHSPGTHPAAPRVCHGLPTTGLGCG